MRPLTPTHNGARDGLGWNGGAWLGGQVGGTAWMLSGAWEFARRAPWLALGLLAGCAATNALGLWLWRRRDRRRMFQAMTWLLLAVGGVALATAAALGWLTADRAAWTDAERQEVRQLYVITLIGIPAFLVWARVMDRNQVALARQAGARVSENLLTGEGDPCGSSSTASG